MLAYTCTMHSSNGKTVHSPSQSISRLALRPWPADVGMNRVAGNATDEIASVDMRNDVARLMWQEENMLPCTVGGCAIHSGIMHSLMGTEESW